MSRFAQTWGILGAEITWFVFLIWLRLRCCRRQDLTGGRQRVLRQLLRRWPYWVRGHLLFGLGELDQFLSKGGSIDSRALASLRLSAEAVFAILRNTRRASPRSWTCAKYLMANYRYLNGNYDRAFSEFATVLAYNNRGNLSKQALTQALNSAAVAAYQLQEFKQALEFISELPISDLLPETAEIKERCVQHG